jgi:hypothetical protein
MLMVSATGDWTANTPHVEYPEIRSIYRLYGADDHLAWAQVDAEHNYNAESRGHVYRWLARWLLGRELAEDPERPIGEENLSRWRLYPRGAADLPPSLPRNADLEAQLRLGTETRQRSFWPADAAGVERLRSVTRTRLAHVLGCAAPAAEEVLAEFGEPAAYARGSCRPLTLGRRGHAERIRALWCEPAAWKAGAAATAAPCTPVLVVHGAGLAGLADAYGNPGSLIAALLEAGRVVLAIEPLYTGDVPACALPSEARDWFEQSFNPPLAGWRAQDVLTALAYLRGLGHGDPALVGLGAAGTWALLGGALAGRLSYLYAELATPDLVGAEFAPALSAYGGLPVAAATVEAASLALYAPALDASWLQRCRDLTGATPACLTPLPAEAYALAAWICRDAPLG